MLSNESFSDPSIEKAKKWAEKIWDEAQALWPRRSGQDYAYRMHVVEPSLSKLITELKLNYASLIVEFGCGDGAHSIFWRQQLNNSNLNSVQILGVDLFKSLIIKAKENASGYKNISFEVADVTDINTAKMIHDKVGVPDVIVAVFILQDIPDLEGVLKTMKLCLKEKGHLISVFVHPDFAEHLFKAGHIKKLEEGYLPPDYITDSGIVQWRFVGYYPIIQQDLPPFYLPYFHRSLQDYYDALKLFEFAVKQKIPLIPDQDTMNTLKEKNILPFVQSKWNIYWPLIIEIPSSMLIYAVKET